MFVVEIRKPRCGPDPGGRGLKSQTQLRRGISVEREGKHDEDTVKLNI